MIKFISLFITFFFAGYGSGAFVEQSLPQRYHLYGKIVLIILILLCAFGISGCATTDWNNVQYDLMNLPIK
jgi:uncharacterized membrane protein